MAGCAKKFTLRELGQEFSPYRPKSSVNRAKPRWHRQCLVTGMRMMQNELNSECGISLRSDHFGWSKFARLPLPDGAGL
jgi:hypothetical protein